MRDALDEIDRIAPTRRPIEKPIGYHKWSDLLFVHWELPPTEVEPLIPKELSVDTFHGSAWVGFVAFHMSGVRPWWFPAVPGISSFHETNLRTYVHLDGRDPGVWFISLDASSSLAVDIARRRWMLPYFRSRMIVKRTDSNVHYESERLWPGKYGYQSRTNAQVGDLIASLDKDLPHGGAVPGSLEHFLAERYFLYAKSDDGDLFRGQVHHSPYSLREASLVDFEEQLTEAAGIPVPEQPQHVLFSEGVSVEVFRLKPVSQ